MPNERKAKIYGEIVIGEDCNFDDLVKDIFGCCKKYNAKPNFKIIEILLNEEEVQHNKAINNIVQNSLEKKKHDNL